MDNKFSEEKRLEESCMEMEKSLQRMQRDMVEDLSIYIKTKVELEVKRVLRDLLDSDKEKIKENLQVVSAGNDLATIEALNEIKSMLLDLMKNSSVAIENHISNRNVNLASAVPTTTNRIVQTSVPEVSVAKPITPVASEVNTKKDSDYRMTKYYRSENANLSPNNDVVKKEPVSIAPPVVENASLNEKIEIVSEEPVKVLKSVSLDSKAVEFVKKYRLNSRNFSVKLQVDEDSAEILGLYSSWSEWKEDRESGVTRAYLTAGSGMTTYTADVIPGESNKFYVAPAVHKFPNAVKAIQMALYKFFDYEYTNGEISSKTIILEQPAIVEKISDEEYTLVSKGILSYL